MTKVLVVTSAPHGDAPLWVREKWIGLRLPLQQQDATPVHVHGVGVLTGPQTFLGQWIARLLGKLTKIEGYIVSAPLAIDMLAAKDSNAAAWWRENVPVLIKKGRTLIFDTACGQIEEDAG